MTGPSSSDPVVPGTLSPDRNWVWTGGGWVHASQAQYSADRAFIWNGTQWLPNAGAPPSTPNAPVPIPNAQAPSAAWGAPRTTPKGHTARNVAIGVGALIVVAAIISNVAKGPSPTTSTNTKAVVAVAPTPTPTPSPTPKPSPSPVAKAPSCTPQPCGNAYSLTVRISGVNRNEPAGFLKPEAGNHFVLMQMTMHNDGGQDTKHINPFDFKLRDAAGVSHDVTFSDAPGCDVWSAVDLAPGATYGPKPLCFEASGDPSGALTLLWTPDFFGPTQEIHV